MSKITFRADDDLVDELEAFDASKSEVMREALRSYLESNRRESSTTTHRGDPSRDARASPQEGHAERSATIDGAVRDVVRRVLDEELERRTRSNPQDVNVTVALDGVEERPQREEPAGTDDRRTADRTAGTEGPTPCTQCGEELDPMHVFCPNCGEKASRRIFCECGEEVRSDWSFCPGCGRRTPAADVLDSR